MPALSRFLRLGLLASVLVLGAVAAHAQGATSGAAPLGGTPPTASPAAPSTLAPPFTSRRPTRSGIRPRRAPARGGNLNGANTPR